MRNLVSRADLDVDETGFWKRLPWASGLLFGAVMAVFAFVDSPADSDGALAIAFVVGLLSGPLFGWLLTVFLRRSFNSINDRVFNADSKLVPEPDGRAEWKYRLPCSLLKSPHFAIGGVLYLGASGMQFQPHRRNPKQHQKPLLMQPLDHIEVTLASTPPKRIAKLLVPRPPRRVRIHWPAGESDFIVPTPSRTVEALRSHIREFR